MPGGITVRVTLREDNGEPVKMLFGNSYKDWTEQAAEFIYRRYGNPENGWRYSDVVDRVIGVERSLSRWIAWGGLKWCTEPSMQANLDREGVQRDEPDNPKPRLYRMFSFDYSPAQERRLLKELKRY